MKKFEIMLYLTGNVRHLEIITCSDEITEEDLITEIEESKFYILPYANNKRKYINKNHITEVYISEVTEDVK